MTIPGSVCDKKKHRRLLLNIDEYCSIANIPPDIIHIGLGGVCSDEELEIYKKLRRSTHYGFLYKDTIGKDILRKMQLITAFLLRNYQDARIFTLNNLLSHISDKKENPSYVLVPNFYIYDYGENNLQKWQLQILYDWLIEMEISNKRVFIYVDDMQWMAKHYGKMINDFIVSRYMVIP